MKPTLEKIKRVLTATHDAKKIISIFVSNEDSSAKTELDAFIDAARKKANQKKDFYLVLVEEKS